MLLRLRMSPYGYAYRTCKRSCGYAYACVVLINQALTRKAIKLHTHSDSLRYAKQPKGGRVVLYNGGFT